MSDLTFSSLTVAELTSMKEALLTFFTTRVASGLASYTVEGVSIARMDPFKLAQILDAVSNELARRADTDAGDGFGIVLAELGGA